MNVFQRLREFWLSESIGLVPPASVDEIASFERRHDVVLPADFKGFLTTVGGMNEGETDELLIAFASLPLLEEPSRWTHLEGCGKGVIFADFSLFTHYYVRDIGTGAVHIADDQLTREIARGFSEFIHKYLADPASIAHGWPADAPTN